MTSDNNAPALPDATRLGPSHLTVSDLTRSVAFYERAVGLTRMGNGEGGSAVLGAGATPLLVLHEDRAARPPGRHAGLFHFALLVPTRPALAHALRRLAATRTTITGASDHLVSEAIYLDDPDGLGIEIYRDRPRAEWPHEPGGTVKMATLPLDLEDVAAAATSDPDAGADPGTILGHMHLHVSHLEPAVGFYRDVVGFPVMARYGDAAAFHGAGGYHHHLGINTWQGVGVPPAPEDVAGLRRWTVEVGAANELAALEERLEAAGAAPEREGEAVVVRDPSGNAVRFEAD